jgi:hypothetical protein
LLLVVIPPAAPGAVTSAGQGGDDVLLMMRAISETIGELIKWASSPAASKGAELDVRRIKNAAAAKVGLNRAPKLVDILAALPEAWRKKLAPLLTAKPIRSASGISVVAVMCKPHRCPHIAMTGNICVSVFTLSHPRSAAPCCISKECEQRRCCLLCSCSVMLLVSYCSPMLMQLLPWWSRQRLRIQHAGLHGLRGPFQRATGTRDCVSASSAGTY